MSVEAILVLYLNSIVHGRYKTLDGNFTGVRAKRLDVCNGHVDFLFSAVDLRDDAGIRLAVADDHERLGPFDLIEQAGLERFQKTRHRLSDTQAHYESASEFPETALMVLGIEYLDLMHVGLSWTLAFFMLGSTRLR